MLSLICRQHISARISNVLQFSVRTASNITATYSSLVVSCRFTCAASVPADIGLIFIRLRMIKHNNESNNNNGGYNNNDYGTTRCGGGRFSAPNLLYNGYRVFPGGKAAGV